MLSVFFFLRYGDLRDLHSFPTRRSSDLGFGPGAQMGAANTDADGAERFRVRRAGRGSRDRKSTRLNSSHVRISYAVFCLKKKKPTTNYRPAQMIIRRDNYSSAPGFAGFH